MRPAVLLVFAAIQSLLGGWVWEIYFWPLATVQLLRCNSSLCPCAFLFSHLPSKHLPFSSPFFFSSFPSFNAVTLQTEKGLLVIHKMVGCWHKQHRQWQGKSARVCVCVRMCVLYVTGTGPMTKMKVDMKPRSVCFSKVENTIS